MLATTLMLPVYGKLGDLVGHKSLFIGALGLFLAGSVIGGLSMNMTMLIAGRAVQGLGGGGLMVLSHAIIADIVPPRQRGKYMGFMVAVFGLSSLVGPVLGGWFTEDLGWRWVFWLNIPLGLLAIAAAVAFLRKPLQETKRPRVDIPGIATMSVAVTAVVLVASWGGTEYGWASPTILGLIALAVVAGTAFVFIERRAPEPVMPLHLFRDRNFNLATLGGVFTAIALFGVVSYMPTYLQMATGFNPTDSGFLMLPGVIGLIIMSSLVGSLASRTGRYKWMPLASSLMVALSLYLLSTMTVDSSIAEIVIFQFVFGAGIGIGMPILVLIVQNSFPITEVGTATASSYFFREIGASLGAAVVGTLFTSRLLSLLARAAAAAGGGPLASLDGESLTPGIINQLPAEAKSVVVHSYNEALTPVYLYLVPLLVAGAVLLLFVREKPLALTNERAA